jgi:pyruvate dehydrogenase E1 component alpha subunit
VGDIARTYYRTKQEEQQWVQERDPIKILSTALLEQGLAKQASLDLIKSDLEKEMDAAVQFAVDAPYPGLDEVDQDIYA